MKYFFPQEVNFDSKGHWKGLQYIGGHVLIIFQHTRVLP